MTLRGHPRSTIFVSIERAMGLLIGDQHSPWPYHCFWDVVTGDLLVENLQFSPPLVPHLCYTPNSNSVPLALDR